MYNINVGRITKKNPDLYGRERPPILFITRNVARVEYSADMFHVAIIDYTYMSNNIRSNKQCLIFNVSIFSNVNF